MSKKIEREKRVSAIGGFSNPSKMPTLSYSTPAYNCILGSILRNVENSTCSGCYALKGCYVFPSTRDAMERRFSKIKEVLESAIARAEFLENFSWLLTDRFERTCKAIAKNGKPGADDGRYFRWHDSGDLQSTDHFRLLCEVAESAPMVTFWLPTRETGMIQKYLNEDGIIPSNLTVRLSIPLMDRGPQGMIQTLMDSEGTVTASGVHNLESAIGETCPAYQNDGACGDCRACWDPSVELVTYPKH